MAPLFHDDVIYPGARRTPRITTRSEVEVYVDASKAAADLAASPGKGQAQAWFDFQKDLFEPYIKAGKFHTFDGDAEMVPGIHSMATQGMK